MSLKNKVILAGMIIRGVATFGLTLYMLVNFAHWLIADSYTTQNE